MSLSADTVSLLMLRAWAIQLIWINKLWYQSRGSWSDGVAYFNRLAERVSLVLNVLWWNLLRNNSSVWSCILEKCILKQKSEWSIGCSSAVSPGPTHAALQHAARLSNWIEYIYLLNVLYIHFPSFDLKPSFLHGNKKYFCYLKIDLNCISEGTACL